MSIDQSAAHGSAPGSTPPAPAPSDTVRHYTLRRAGPADIDRLATLERQVFPTVWPPTNFARDLKKSNEAVLVAVLEQESGDERTDGAPRDSLVSRVVDGIKTIARTAGDGGRTDVAGWVLVWFVGVEAHIASIGVAESDRRRGVGELLILGAIEAAAAQGCEEVTLEVRASNEAAQSLYRKYGFRQVGVRKGYYVDDGEDALIMTTPDITAPDYARLLATLADDHERRWSRAGSRFARG